VASELSASGANVNVGWEWIEAGLLFPYVKSPLVYKCPADTGSVNSFGILHPHVRSMSMNAWIGTPPADAWANDFRLYRKETDLTVPGPINTWLLMDENPFSINDSWMVEDPGTDKWIDGPASYHDRACGITFTDGHAQIKQWRDQAILSPAIVDNWPSRTPVAPLQNPPQDLLWLTSRSTATPTQISFDGPP